MIKKALFKAIISVIVTNAVFIGLYWAVIDNFNLSDLVITVPVYSIVILAGSFVLNYYKLSRESVKRSTQPPNGE